MPEAFAPSVDFRHGDLRVSENRRFLVHADGTPFVYLGCTAWELFHRLTREEVDLYLENRRQKGFTVFQAVVLAEFDGLTAPNAYGDLPLHDLDPTRPNEAYFRHVDHAVARAEGKGLFAGILPTWGDKVGPKAWGTGPEVITAGNARAYGRFLGERYRDRPNVIWILGGDRPAEGYLPVWREMAAGLAEGDQGRHLRTFHPAGGRSSSEWLHAEPWLDFNMLQSGHGRRNIGNHAMIAADYARLPVKPCIDAEPRYEDHPIGGKIENGYFDDFDVRQAAYWALFAGACGHTYGCHDIWQMYAPGRKPVTFARTPWREALDLPGAGDMGHARRLIESRPFLSRVPDQELIAEGQSDGERHLQATRGDGYAFVYAPTGGPFSVRLDALGAAAVRAWWFDPREGSARQVGEIPASGVRAFEPPSRGRGNDWVLVLDDAARGFAAPGTLR